MIFLVWILFLLQLLNPSLSDHYRGGTISWKPTNPYSLTSPVEITITERQSWTLYRYPCNETTINTLGVYNDTESASPPTITCISSTAACLFSLYQTINSPLYCTDSSTIFQITSGTYYTTQNLALNSVIDIAWRGASWTTEVLTNSWSLVAHIDLTPLSTKINTSPVTGSLPIFQVYVGVKTVITILADDWDFDQIVRCRWSYQTPLDECGNVCFDLQNATLDTVDCSITWTPFLRPADVANNLTSSIYVIAITAEDFENASSDTALSSIPHQVLVYVSSRPSGTCANRPSISGLPDRNLACYALSVHSTYTFHFTSKVYCTSDSIVDFISSSPFFIKKTDLYQLSNNTWGVNVTWTVLSNQTGLQPFCIASVDNNNQTSTQSCVMFVVGGSNPSFIAPTFVQGTASPIGTVMSTQMSFSIEATLPLRRTTLNQTYISIYQLNGTALVYRIDCKYSPDVYFFNNTLLFFVRNPPWIPGYTYFITLTAGVATANLYCGTEAGSLSGNTTWSFTIWDSSMSSTTTPSTTSNTATIQTVTTRPLGTTTPDPRYTTTGIPAYTTSTTTSTIATTSTSVTTTTTTSATTTTTTTTTTTAYISDVDVIYPKDMERQCLQPITIVAALITVAAIPLHFFAMINLFSKVNSNFQKETFQARNARRTRFPSALELEEEATFV